MKLLREYIVLYILLTLYSLIQKEIAAAESEGDLYHAAGEVDFPEVILN